MTYQFTPLDVMTQAIADHHKIHPWDHAGLAAAMAEAQWIIGSLYGSGYQILKAAVVASDSDAACRRWES